MQERPQHGPGMPQDAPLMERARVAAVRVNEFEERREAEGTPVPDEVYLDLAKATELLSRVRPDLTGAAYLVASEAAAYYILAGSFSAARRLASATLLEVRNNPGLREYVAELLEEAEVGFASGNRTHDPFDPAIEMLAHTSDSVLSPRVLAEREAIQRFESDADQLPTPVSPLVHIVPERVDEPVGMVNEPMGMRAPRISKAVQREISEFEEQSQRDKRIGSISVEQLDEALVWFARGVTDREIARRLGLPSEDMPYLRERQQERLGTESMPEAVLMAVKLGKLDTKGLVDPNFDPQVFSTLSLGEKALLKIYIDSYGASTQELAQALTVKDAAIYRRFASIAYKLSVTERVQAAVAFLEAQRILSNDSAVLVGENQIEVNERLDPKIHLTNAEVATLEAYIASGGVTGADLAEKMGVSAGTIAVRFSNIGKKLGVSGRIGMAEKYLELQGKDRKIVVGHKEQKKRKKAKEATRYSLKMERQVLAGAVQSIPDKDLALVMSVSKLKIARIKSSLIKKNGVSNIQEVVVQMLRKNIVNPRYLVREDFNPDSFGDLTDLEAVVLGKFLENMGSETDQQIGESLGMDAKQISKIIKEIQRQMGARNRIQLLVYASALKEMGYELVLDDDETVIFPKK